MGRVVDSHLDLMRPIVAHADWACSRLAVRALCLMQILGQTDVSELLLVAPNRSAQTTL